MIVTLMCANFIIGNIYVSGTPSVKVVLYHRDSGSVIPCRWFTSVGIYKEFVTSKVEPLQGKEGFLYLDKNGMPMVAMHWKKYFQHICEKYNSIYKMQMP